MNKDIEKISEGNHKAYSELIETLEKVKDAIKKQNFGIAMDVLCKPYPDFQVTTHSELKESEDERIRKCLLSHFSRYQEDEIFLNGITMKQILAWLEKQGNLMGALQISNARIGELIEENYYLKEQLEKQGEQRSSDKIESKFKVKKDKWYVCTNTFVSRRGKIIAIKGQTYQSQQEDNTITCEDNCLFIDRHDGKASDYFRYWTIQDAKDGDVLVASDGSIFLFKGTIDWGCRHYVALTTDGAVKFNEGLKHFWETSTAVHPATKEQRDLLFQKMREAGYKWDADAKVLKEIEQKSAEWTKEDIQMYRNILSYLSEPSPLKEVNGKSREQLLDWFKGLKDRYTWKPSDAQMDALLYIVKHYTPTATEKLAWDSLQTLELMLEQLKKLREE